VNEREDHGPLTGVTVLDLSRVLAGPYATQLLGDMGADVWKVERPGTGDETRGWGPPFVGGESAYYLSANRNKRSAALDFTVPADRDAVLRAARQADIVVENFLPGQLAAHGLEPARMLEANPNLVICSITGYGQDGPYAERAGYDVVLQGFTGLMSITGPEEGPPCKVGVALVDVLTGVHAATATLGAYAGSLRGRGGTQIDIAMFEVGVASLVNVSQGALSTGMPARRHGNAHPHIVPYQTFQAADGALVVAVGNDAQWKRLCEAVGLPEIGADPRYAANRGRALHREDIVAILGERFAGAPRDTWIERLSAVRVPTGPVREMHEVVADPALSARGMLQSAAIGEASTTLFRAPWRAAGTRPPLRLPPPRLGQHTEEFMERFGR
jgi:crotonobetainyl-CoA:carnitine CoA-transferase CaiB-like acyl-CoA transferase